MSESCPSCGSTDFRNVDAGPDGYYDDITYTNEVCQNCGTYLCGWDSRWYDSVDEPLDQSTEKDGGA